MSTPGVNLVKWFPPVDDHLTPEQSALHLRQLYTATNQHDQAIETVDQKVEKLSAAMTTTAAATTSTNTSTTITITEIEGFGNLAAVNNQTGQTAYTVQSSDNGSLVVLSDASPIAVTLNSVVMAPYFVFIANQGTGTATLSASSGSINGTTTIPGKSGVISFFDGASWWIWWIDTVTGVFPSNTPAVLHQWLASYNSTTGAFTQTQPAFTDISGSVAASQLPALTGDATSTAGTAATTVVATHLTAPLPIAQGGTGTASPALVAGSNIAITGSWPNQTITGSGGGAVTSLTTTGSSGASSLISGVLNIPVYSGSGGTPTTVPGLVTWLDASQLTGYSTGNSVVSWDDLARGVPVGVIGSGTAPTYQASVINGLPIIRFAGSSTMQNVGFPVNSQQYTIFMVMKISSLSQAYTAVWGVDSTTAFLIKSNGKTALYFNNASEWDGTGAYVFGTSLFQVISLQVGPTSYICRVALAADQTAAFTGAFGGGTGASQAWQLGNQNGQSGRGISGDFAEVIMYSRNVTSTQLSTIENYLKTKYAL